MPHGESRAYLCAERAERGHLSPVMTYYCCGVGSWWPRDRVGGCSSWLLWQTAHDALRIWLWTWTRGKNDLEDDAQLAVPRWAVGPRCCGRLSRGKVQPGSGSDRTGPERSGAVRPRAERDDKWPGSRGRESGRLLILADKAHSCSQ